MVFLLLRISPDVAVCQILSQDKHKHGLCPFDPYYQCGVFEIRLIVRQCITVHHEVETRRKDEDVTACLTNHMMTESEILLLGM